MISGGQYNHKVDVYSFGILMWEILFEENPYLHQNSPKFSKYGERRVLINDETQMSFNALGKVLKGERPIIPFNIQDKSLIKLWIKDFLYMEDQSAANNEDILNITVNALIAYIELMKECWHEIPTNRPEFAEITLRLTNLLEQF